ncbi:hypothetical protein HK104_006259, partial [Borealophlyctis nickersoniae]
MFIPRANPENPANPTKRVQFGIAEEEEERANRVIVARARERVAAMCARSCEGEEERQVAARCVHLREVEEGRRREGGERAAAIGVRSERERLGGDDGDVGDEEESLLLDARAPWAEALAHMRAEIGELLALMRAQNEMNEDSLYELLCEQIMMEKQQRIMEERLAAQTNLIQDLVMNLDVMDTSQGMLWKVSESLGTSRKVSERLGRFWKDLEYYG